ncbi:MAG: IS110 family transposase, partial [Pseudonocardiaceae bacterium]|nr:IS110 family transposase [Pseudonocardiaceae bacterium]
RAAGDRHNAALRNLSNKLIGRMWWCLHNNQNWDEHAAWNETSTGTEQLAA